MNSSRFIARFSRQLTGAQPPNSRPARRRSILAAVIAPAALLFACACAPSAHAALVFAPTDAPNIRGGQLDGSLTNFVIGAQGGTSGLNQWPAAETPDHAIDGDNRKYLNFG